MKTKLIRKYSFPIDFLSNRFPLGVKSFRKVNPNSVQFNKIQTATYLRNTPCICNHYNNITTLQ